MNHKNVIIIIIVINNNNNIIIEGSMRKKFDPDKVQKRTIMTMIVFWISKSGISLYHFNKYHTLRKSLPRSIFFIRSTVLTTVSCYDSGTNGLCFSWGISFRQRQ